MHQFIALCLVLSLHVALPLHAQLDQLNPLEKSASTLGGRVRLNVFMPPYAEQSLGSWGGEYMLDYQFKWHKIPSLTFVAMASHQTRAFRRYYIRHHTPMPDNPAFGRRVNSWALSAYGRLQYEPTFMKRPGGYKFVDQLVPYTGLGLGAQYAWMRSRLWDDWDLEGSLRRHWQQLSPVAEFTLGVRFHDQYSVDRWGVELSYLLGLQDERAPNAMRWHDAQRDYVPVFRQGQRFRSLSLSFFYALELGKCPCKD